MTTDPEFPHPTGEAAPLPAVAELAPAWTPTAEIASVDASPRPATLTACRCCGFRWLTTIPAPVPCPSCHRGYREPAGFQVEVLTMTKDM